METSEDNEIAELQKEEEKIYKKLSAFIKDLPIKRQQKFYSLLSEYLENQLEIENSLFR